MSAVFLAGTIGTLAGFGIGIYCVLITMAVTA